ncbi:carbohydrate ABC transporter permease [Rhizobium sp. NRK18]|jgi:multiple sugar transport system permease protein|uniref:carbohydrate ABC transporter permease n=1 Tax=Rhizobium sp. NRK18 TaxID=2964667 RepID=UPI0021C3BDEA|nr:sugar ABC transporter permease [Rhizobium sp. NRK18]MCQ2003270.1 sugar ABC transporter permease [Rhizobium sp. NRK18]
MSTTEGDLLHTVETGSISRSRRFWGHAALWLSALWLIASFILQASQDLGWTGFGFDNWRPVLYAYFIWAFVLCVTRVVIYGESGKKALFVLPAALFVVSMVVFPLLFALWVGFSNWNLASLTGRQFNGLDNLRQMIADPFYANALLNMVYYCLAIAIEYAIAFGLALLLNQEIVARKFWRVTFLVPLMLSPVAISWMVGKSMLEPRFGPIARFARWLGWENPSFFGDPLTARLSIMIMDAWTFIPFMMIMLLAGLQALPREVLEAAEVDGATKWQRFWQVIFPLMLPVSVTAVMIRIIFKLKLADIIITVTSGGPGGATDSVTSFIYREYRDRSNVGYGTLLALVYLVIIVIGMTGLMKISDRIVRRMTGRL